MATRIVAVSGFGFHRASSASTPTPKARAQCGIHASWDLGEGHRWGGPYRDIGPAVYPRFRAPIPESKINEFAGGGMSGMWDQGGLVGQLLTGRGSPGKLIENKTSYFNRWNKLAY